MAVAESSINPYQTPNTRDDGPRIRYRFLLVGIFSIAVVGALLALAYSLLMFTLYYKLESARGGPVPIYIPTMLGMIVCCVVALAYSFARWRSRKFFTAFAFYILAFIGLSTGPWGMIMLVVTFS